ncbi:hypothetical protein HID58_032999, partial [Brassica napus]
THYTAEVAYTSLSFSSVLSLRSFTEEKLRSRSITLVFSRRVTSRGWAPSGVASSLDGRPTFRSGVRAFFSGVGRPAQVLSGYGLIRPDLSFRRRIYLRWTAGFCFRRPHLLLRCWTAGFCLRVTIFLGGDGGLLSGLPDYGFDLRSSERSGFQRRPFCLDGFFSVKAPFHRSSFQPLRFRRRKTVIHVLTRVHWLQDNRTRGGRCMLSSSTGSLFGLGLKVSVNVGPLYWAFAKFRPTRSLGFVLSCWA